MATSSGTATYYGFDFETSYENARQKALGIAERDQYIGQPIHTEDDFKRSFLEVFHEYLGDENVYSPEELIVTHQALEFILAALLGRYFKSNALVTHADLNTFLTIIEWLKEIIEHILNP